MFAVGLLFMGFIMLRFVVVVQLLSHVQLFMTPWTVVCSCPLNWWCHLHLILCCPLFLLPSVFPNIRVFSNEPASHVRWPKYRSFSISFLAMNIQGWFPLGLIGLISLLSKRLSIVFSSTTIQKYQFFSAQPSLCSNSHICTWLLEKP